MVSRQPRYSKEEFAQRGDHIYETRIHPNLSADHQGQYVAIDIETSEYEVADDILTATNALFERIPSAQPQRNGWETNGDPQS